MGAATWLQNNCKTIYHSGLASSGSLWNPKVNRSYNRVFPFLTSNQILQTATAQCNWKQ